jgi:Tol biopolymer transport system component
MKTRFTFQPMNEATPVWSPDGRWVYYISDQENVGDIWRRAIDGSDQGERVVATPQEEHPSSVSPNGRELLYYVMSKENGIPGLMLQPVVGGGEAAPVLMSDQAEWNGQFSPDGRWIAYQSDASGKDEVYLASHPSGNGRWQVSTGGGSWPRWRRDGRELFYLTSDQKIAAVSIGNGSNPIQGTPTSLFDTHKGGGSVFSYDVTADGQRFLLSRLLVQPGEENLTLVTNWTSLLDR